MEVTEAAYRAAITFLRQFLYIENIKCFLTLHVFNIQGKEYFEVISLHCYSNNLIRFTIRLTIPNRKTHQMRQIFG